MSSFHKVKSLRDKGRLNLWQKLSSQILKYPKLVKIKAKKTQVDENTSSPGNNQLNFWVCYAECFTFDKYFVRGTCFQFRTSN